MKKTAERKQLTHFLLLALLVSFALGLSLGSTSAVDVEAFQPPVVNISGNAFVPNKITIPKGESVVWINLDAGNHTVTSNDTGPNGFDSGDIASGKNYTRQFTSAGVYPYYCKIHTSMTGIINVTEGGGFDCHQFNTSATCMNHTQDNCYWNDKGGPTGSGECFSLDPNQPHCFIYDNNQTACNATQGCEWVTQGNNTYCGAKGTGYCSKFNKTECLTQANCTWVREVWDNNTKEFCGVNMGGGMNPECQTNCTKCSDPGMCSGSPKQCHWNYTASPNRCEDGRMDVNPCEGLFNPTCDNTFGCRYDANYSGTGAGKCVVDTRMNVSGCASYPLNSSCNGDVNCEWILDQRDGKYKCMQKGGSDCEKIGSQQNCTANPKCMWDYKYNKCYPSFGGGVCESINTPEVCKNTAGCKWDDPQWRCVGGSVVNCSAQTTQALCIMYGECKWNATSSVCELSPCASDCSSCDKSDSCMKSPRGCWWDFGQAKCNQHQEPTCANGMCDRCTTAADCYNTTLHPTNNFCAWFENVSQAPGYQPPPAKAGGISALLLEGGNFTEPKCRMNTTCAQDCFMCNSQTTCLNSSDTAFSNTSGACNWDPLSSWNPCFPKGKGGGAGPCDTNCTQCGDQWSCGGSPMGCSWNATASPPCSQSNCFTLGCSYCVSQENCMKADGKWRGQNATGCIWQDYGNGTKTCSARSCETDCSLCMTQTACSSSTLNCSWNNQTNACNFPAGSSSGCNADCTICGVDYLCWSSYAGCKWIYEGHYTVDLINNGFSMPGMTQGSFTLRKNEALYFSNRDNVTHNLTIDNYTGSGFPLTLNANSGQDVTFSVPGTYVIYDTILGKAVMNMTLTVTSEVTKVCRPNACKNNCGDCRDPTSCTQSYAGCAWDMNTGNCNIQGYGMTCATDCFACDSELKCNASNATMQTPQGQMNGCQWIFDPIDGRNGCKPKGITFDCNTMCEMCNQAQCANATPTMLPIEAKSCKWFPNEMRPNGSQGMCHPDAFTGAGSNCPAWDYTSKVQCESNPGCRWESVSQKCLINSGSLTCDQVCDKCNQTQCNAKAPKCKWDVPPVGSPFCREDYSGGFKYGGNCQQNCFDCFDNQSCTGSTAGCRWVKDAMSPTGYHCDPADKPICAEDCFQCFSPQDCLASNNSLKAFKSTNYCVWVDQQYFKYCKPNITMEICFAPGDEDNDSLENCKDPDCSMDPFCQYGGGGPMGTDKDCFQWDQMNGGNKSVCECGNATLVNGSCMSGGSVVNGTGCVWHTVPKGNTTEGLCDPKFSDMVFTGMGEDMPNFILHDPCQSNEPPWVNAEKNVLENISFLDICDIGIRDMPNTTAFILNLKSVNDLALCNFLSPSSQNQSGKYYFLLDTDKNTSSGCSVQVNITETDRTPQNFVFGEGGFEYRLDYEVGFSNNTPTETRTVYKCINGSWSISQATVSGKKDKACEYKSIYYGILKSDIGNPLSTIHIIAFTADASGGWSNNVLYAKDRAYHAYYTPNTIDFVPPDCASNPTACGSGFDAGTGVMTFENCFPGTGDEDKDGKTNCADEDCLTSIFCAVNNTYNASEDKTAPKITSSTVDAEQTMAVVKWTTDEPATGVVQFYGRNNTCELGVQNVSQYDDAFFPMDDYTPTHVVPLDSNNPDAAYKLNYALEPNTSYYYKLRSCDQARVYNNATNSTSPNCAVSACLNFTTKPPCESITNETICKRQGICNWYANMTPNCQKEIQFGFEWTSNTSDPTNPLGGVNFEMDFGTGNATNVTAGTKIKTNESGCNVTLKFKNEMTMLVGGKAPWIMEMQRCCVPKETINLTDALQIANASNESLYLGMNSPVWQLIAQKMGCKKVYLHLPGFHQDCANITITHCNENGANCTDVSLDNASMIFCNSSVSVWELAGSDPTLFSTYTNEYGIDAYAPRVLSGPTVLTASGTVAAIATTANENCNVSVNYRECDMVTYNATGSCAQYPENLTQQGRWAYNTTDNLTSHITYLTNLTENTKYYYRVIATDASSNQRILDNQEAYYSFNSGTQSTIQQYGLVTGWNLISLPLSA